MGLTTSHGVQFFACLLPCRWPAVRERRRFRLICTPRVRGGFRRVNDEGLESVALNNAMTADPVFTSLHFVFPLLPAPRKVFNARFPRRTLLRSATETSPTMGNLPNSKSSVALIALRGGERHDVLALLHWFDFPIEGGVGWCNPSPVMSMKCSNVRVTHLNHCPSWVLKLCVVV